MLTREMFDDVIHQRQQSEIVLVLCAPSLLVSVERIVAAVNNSNNAGASSSEVGGVRSAIVVRSIDEAELLRCAGTGPAPAAAAAATAAAAASPTSQFDRNACTAAAAAAAAAVAAARAASANDRLCTFHTSGTTGDPKAVHSSCTEFNAFVTAAAVPYHLNAASRVFVGNNTIFDPSAGLTFAALAVGATVCLAPWQCTLQHPGLCIELTQATHVCSTPAVWALHDGAGIRATTQAPSPPLLPAETAVTGPATPRAAPLSSALETIILGGEPVEIPSLSNR